MNNDRTSNHPSVEVRKGQIRNAVVAAMERRKRARYTRRVIGFAISAIAFAGASGWWLAREHPMQATSLETLPQRTSATLGEMDPRSGEASRRPARWIQRVETRSDFAERHADREATQITERIGDAELIGLLGEMGRTAGIIRIGDEARLSMR